MYRHSVARPLIAALAVLAVLAAGAAHTATIAGAGESPAALTAEAADPPFDVFEYRVLGNTLLSNEQIEAVLYPLLGSNRTLAKVQEARAALEKLYQDSGFSTVYVDVPEQTVGNGIVRLQVTESKIGRLRVTGADYVSGREVLAGVPALVRGKTPNLPAVQAQLAEFNQQSRDRSIVPVLKAGAAPGLVDVELKVDDRLPIHGSAEYNNRYTRNTSETRLQASLSYDNLWQRNHSLSLQYQLAPEEQQQLGVAAATYLARFRDSRDVLALYAIKTNSDISAIGALSVVGRGSIVGLRYVKALAQSAASTHSLSLGSDYKDFGDSLQIDTDSDAVKTGIRYLNWAYQYSYAHNFKRSSLSAGTGGSFGLRGIGNSSQEFADKRFKARANYAALRASARYSYAVTPWIGVSLGAEGQYADSPLINNEQFGIGGAESVRGYLESQELGDYGWRSSLELKVSNAGSKRPAWLNRWEFLLFADAGQAYLRDPLPDQLAAFRLFSAGAGMRFTAFTNLEAALDWAQALKADGEIASGDSRAHFSLRYGF